MKYISFKVLPAILLLVLCAANAVAQSTLPLTGSLKKDSVIAGKPTPKNKLWLGFNVEPQFEDLIVPAKDHPASRNYLPGGALTAGFNLCYQIGRTAGLETGIEYKFSDIKSTGNSNMGDEQFHSVQIPALLTLHTHGQKIRFFCAAGFAIGADIVDRYSQRYPGPVPAGIDPGVSGSVTQTSGISTLYCWFESKAGVEMNVSENTVVKIGAAFNVSATSYTSLGIDVKYTPPFINSLPVPVSPYSVGLNVAVLFGVKTHGGRILK